ncbi:hypothetical protein Lalb_Chr04g0252051 [Lupinus albus]|uniref:Uncharacterized protein n=1 Tax=Lupinus albus TaxID=3870 RepID=A0A6A4QMG2_LUPAL|nr:hypothetical protein Lalb_Chr04g0252051 [Lupinus albus]
MIKLRKWPQHCLKPNPSSSFVLAWYSIIISAWCLSSILNSLKNLQIICN